MSAKTGKVQRRIVFIALICLVFVAGSVGGAYAYLKANTDVLSNEFVPAKVTCAVEEEFADGVKSNVKVRNTGNVDAYIRATVKGTIQDLSREDHADGSITVHACIDGLIQTFTFTPV